MCRPTAPSRERASVDREMRDFMSYGADAD